MAKGHDGNLKQKRNWQQPVKWSLSGKSYQSLSFESIKEVYGLIYALKNLVGYICSHIFSALTALYRGSGEIALFKVKSNFFKLLESNLELDSNKLGSNFF